MPRNTADISQFTVPKPNSMHREASTPGKHAGERKQKLFRIQRTAARQLALLKVETERTETDLVTEALNLLFQKYGMPAVRG